MALPPAPLNFPDELLFVRLAREIAIDHFELETILKHYQIPTERWEIIKNNARFQSLLESQIADWQSATNTQERSKLKAAALLEEWFPTANMELHDRNASLSGRVELAKLLARIAGMGENRGGEVLAGEKFSITINLGADAKLKFDKQVTPKVIDAEILESPNGT